MTRLERYREKLRQLEEKRNELMRSGQYIKSMVLNEDIKEVERAIKEAEEYEERSKPKPIKEMVSKHELDEMGIIPLMIICHLAADFLTQEAYEVVDRCKAYGFDDVVFSPDLRDLLKASEKFAGFLTKVSPELRDLLLRNETFNSSLHKRYVKYIEQRMINNKNNKKQSNNQQ